MAVFGPETAQDATSDPRATLLRAATGEGKGRCAVCDSLRVVKQEVGDGEFELVCESCGATARRNDDSNA